MKRLILFILIIQKSCVLYAQRLSDTIKLSSVTILDYKVGVPSSYKAMKFDSLALARNEFSSLSELISSSTSIHMKDYGVGALSSISLRGTGAGHTQLYWNGIALNSPMLGQVDFSLFPLVFIDDIELHEGAGSIMDGSGGLGGSFQVVNEADWNNRLSLKAQSQVASFDTYAQQARVKWGDKKWQFHTSLLHKYAQNDFVYRDYHLNNRELRRENAELNQMGVMQEVYHKLNEKNTVSVRSWYFESDRNLPNILGSESNGENQYDASLRSMLEWENIGSRHLLEVRAAYLTDELNYYNSTIATKSLSSTSSAQFYSRYTNYLNRKIKFVTQLQSSTDEAKSTGYENRKSRNSISNLTGFGYSNLSKRFNADIYSRQEYFGDEKVYWIPTVGVNYRFLKKSNWIVKASASQNIKYPTLNDLYWENAGNPDLEVEESRTVEAGFTNNHMILKNKHSLSVELTAFHSFVDNWIIWQPNGNVWRPDNLRKVESKGVEAITKLNLAYRRIHCSVGLNYAYTMSNNLSNVGRTLNTVGKQIIYTPVHKAGGFISCKRQGWYVTYQQRYTGDVYIDAQNNRYLPAFTLTDVILGKEVKLKAGMIGIQLSARNIYDAEYQLVAERPMPGRHYLASIKYILN